MGKGRIRTTGVQGSKDSNRGAVNSGKERVRCRFIARMPEEELLEGTWVGREQDGEKLVGTVVRPASG